MLVRLGCFFVAGIYVLTSIDSCTGQLNEATANDVVKSRQKRIVFPYNAALGYIMAIAVPLGIPNRNIFVSYNFEANYNSPQDSAVFTEGLANIIKGYVEPLSNYVPLEPIGIGKRSADRRQNQLPLYAQITRRQIYKTIRKQLQEQHFNGKKCLLRMICEAALHPFGEANGLVGDLVQLVLSPSTSKDERLPKEYLIAEVAGSNGSCAQYRPDCPKDPLEFVSFMKE